MTVACVNGRHDHRVRQGQSCDRPHPAPPAIHRAAGTFTLAAAVGIGVMVVAGWRTGEWIAARYLEVLR